MEAEGAGVTALSVLTDGRADFLAETMEGIKAHLGEVDGPRFIVDDSGNSDYASWLRHSYPQFKLIHHTTRRGLAGAVQSVFDTALDTGCDYLVHIEDDMVLTRDVPVADAIAVLEAHSNLAQMCFKRVAVPDDGAADQLQAILNRSSFYGSHDTWTWYDYLFSLGPCVIPRRVLELGWPSGPIGVGNEDGMTKRCLDAGYVFGSWGLVTDEPWARHVGYGNRTTEWAL